MIQNGNPVARVARLGAATLTFLSLLSLAGALFLSLPPQVVPKWAPPWALEWAKQGMLQAPPAPLPAPAPAIQPVGSSALFEALTQAGPPGLADELRAINAQLDANGADAEASHRLAAVINRLGQSETVPALVLSRMADRLDAAMATLREARTPPPPPVPDRPSRLLLLAASFGVGAALLGLAAAPPVRRPTDVRGPEPLRLPPSTQENPPVWAEALPARLEAVVRDAAAAANPNRQEIGPSAAEVVRGAMRAGAHLASVALDAEQRLEAAARHAETILFAVDRAGPASAGPADIPRRATADLAGLRLGEIADRLEDALTALSSITARAGQAPRAAAVPEALPNALPEVLERLESIAVSLSGSATPLANLVTTAGAKARQLGEVSESLAAIARPLLVLVRESVPPTIERLTALGDRFERQAETADGAVGRIADLADRMGTAGAALPLMLDQLAALGDSLEKQVAAGDGSVARVAQVAGQLESAGAALPLMLDQLTGLTDRLEKQGESSEGLLGRITQVAGRLELVGEVLPGTLGRLVALDENLGRQSTGIEQAVGRTGEAASRVEAAGETLPPLLDRLATLSDRLGEQVTTGDDVVARATDTMGRLQTAGDGLPPALERLSALCDSLGAQAGRTAEVLDRVTEVATRFETSGAALPWAVERIANLGARLGRQGETAGSVAGWLTEVAGRLRTASETPIGQKEPMADGGVGTEELDQSELMTRDLAGRVEEVAARLRYLEQLGTAMEERINEATAAIARAVAQVAEETAKPDPARSLAL